MSALAFEVLHQDQNTRARLGRLITPHGVVDTPAFVPVGTQATVKTLTPADLDALGVQMIIADTYHLHLRPGEALREESARFRRDHAPLAPDCACPTCQTHARAYLHHLFRAHEMLGPRLLSAHNLHVWGELMRQVRKAIAEGRLEALRDAWLRRV